jgi:hypothetical protein
MIFKDNNSSILIDQNENSESCKIKKFNNTQYVIPDYCQTCNCIKTNLKRFDHYSFCSLECFNIASQTHGGGAILPVQMYQGEPCFILIKDATRKDNYSELAGGKKQIYEGAGKTCAREGTEELGLRKNIKHHYLETNGVRLLTWYNKNNPYEPNTNSFIDSFIKKESNEIEKSQNDNQGTETETEIKTKTESYFNYTIYVIAIENFDIKEANLAAQARQLDNNLNPEWKETQTIFLIPIKNLELFANDKISDIYDYKGDKIPPISNRWYHFIKNLNTIKIMKSVIFSKIKPWKVNINNKPYKNSFVWSHKDLNTI